MSTLTGEDMEAALRIFDAPDDVFKSDIFALDFMLDVRARLRKGEEAISALNEILIITKKELI